MARATNVDVHSREPTAHSQGCSSSSFPFQIGKESKETAECTMVLRNVATVFNNRRDVVYQRTNGFIGISFQQSGWRFFTPRDQRAGEGALLAEQPSSVRRHLRELQRPHPAGTDPVLVRPTRSSPSLSDTSAPSTTTAVAFDSTKTTTSRRESYFFGLSRRVTPQRSIISGRRGPSPCL